MSETSFRNVRSTAAAFSHREQGLRGCVVRVLGPPTSNIFQELIAVKVRLTPESFFGLVKLETLSKLKKGLCFISFIL